MTLAACLAFYGMLFAVTAPRLLRRQALEHAPRLGVAMWTSAAVTTLVAWLAATGIAVADVTMAATMTCDDCAPYLGLFAGVPHLLAAVLAVVGVLAAGRLVVEIGRQLRRSRLAVQGHLRGVRLVGRPAPHLGPHTVVVDAAECAAYCLARCGDQAVVVTSASVRELPADQLSAVLAHERAHLAGRHHLLLTWLTALARPLPRIELFRLARTEVTRLLEMSADDTAARTHGRRTLLDALMTLACGPAPGPALGAGGTATLERARRLQRSPTRAERSAARRELGTIVVTAGVAPTVVFAAMLITTCTMVLA